MSDQSKEPAASTATSSRRESRRKKILSSSEDRLKLITGQRVDHEPKPASERRRIRKRSEMRANKTVVDESPDDAPQVAVEAKEMESAMKTRTDPRLRRRQAALRRKEEMEQSAGNVPSDASEKTSAASASVASDSSSRPEKTISASPPSAINSTSPGKELSFDEEFRINAMHTAEDYVATLLIVLAAIASAFVLVDHENLVLGANQRNNDPRYTPYFELIDQGIPLESVRQQLEREDLDPSVVTLSTHLPFGASPEDFSLSSSEDVLGGVFTTILQPSVLMVLILIRVIIMPVVGIAIRSMYGVSVSVPSRVPNPFKGNFVFSIVSQVIGPKIINVVMNIIRFVEDGCLFLFVLTMAAALPHLANQISLEGTL